MSISQLQNGIESAWKFAYRYRSIARRIVGNPSGIPLAITANLGYRFYAHHLRQFYTCDWFLPREKPAPMPAGFVPVEALTARRAAEYV
jgi:hypothetical protein